MDLQSLTGLDRWTDTPNDPNAYSTWQDRVRDLMKGRIQKVPEPDDYSPNVRGYVLDQIINQMLEQRKSRQQLMNLNQLIQMLHKGPVDTDPRFDSTYGSWM